MQQYWPSLVFLGNANRQVLVFNAFKHIFCWEKETTVQLYYDL